MTTELDLCPLDDQRRQRIARCLLESMPSDNEIIHARNRFLRARAMPRRVGAKALLITIVQGMVLGLASGATAAFVADRVVESESPAAAPKVEQSSGASRPRARERAKRSSSADEAAFAVPVAPMPRAAFEATPAAPASPPKAAAVPNVHRPEFHSPARVLASPPRPPKTPEATRSSAQSAFSSSNLGVLPPEDSSSVGPWERVAKALEAGDWSGADQALADLSASGDAHARDAAALARAQLWITQGRGAEVRTTLQQLAENGQTPLIRRRAAALLHEL